MGKMFAINDVSGQNNELSSHAGQFLPYAHKRLGFNKPVGVNFISDPENAKDPLGKTAYYDPNKMEITIFVDKRHVKDILRSLSHELVHHSQNCRGDFGSGVSTEPGYAQKDPHMRKMEAEAYLLGNGFLFRDWEDQLKQKKENITMSEGYKRDELEEGGGHHGQTCEEAHEGKEHSLWEEGKLEEYDETGTFAPGQGEIAKKKSPSEEDEERARELASDAAAKAEETNENWFKGNKDQLLFETLMKKWTK
jgi:hypothetical protein